MRHITHLLGRKHRLPQEEAKTALVQANYFMSQPRSQRRRTRLAATRVEFPRPIIRRSYPPSFETISTHLHRIHFHQTGNGTFASDHEPQTAIPVAQRTRGKRRVATLMWVNCDGIHELQMAQLVLDIWV